MIVATSTCPRSLHPYSLSLCRKNHAGEPVIIWILDELNSFYLDRLHPDFAENLNLGSRKWSWWPQFSLAHLRDQMKAEFIMFEAISHLKSPVYLKFQPGIFQFAYDDTTLTELGIIKPVCCKQEFRGFRFAPVSYRFSYLGAPCTSRLRYPKQSYLTEVTYLVIAQPNAACETVMLL